MSHHTSERKDKITTDHSREETERVHNEQEYIKQKGHEVASKAKDVKEGNVSMPSNEKITSALQHGQDTLTNLQTSDRGRQMNSGGEKVCICCTLFSSFLARSSISSCHSYLHLVITIIKLFIR